MKVGDVTWIERAVFSCRDATSQDPLTGVDCEIVSQPRSCQRRAKPPNKWAGMGSGPAGPGAAQLPGPGMDKCLRNAGRIATAAAIGGGAKLQARVSLTSQRGEVASLLP